MLHPVSRGVFDLITLTTSRPTASSDELIQRVIQQGEMIPAAQQTDALKSHALARLLKFIFFRVKPAGEPKRQLCGREHYRFLSG